MVENKWTEHNGETRSQTNQLFNLVSQLSGQSVTELQASQKWVHRNVSVFVPACGANHVQVFLLYEWTGQHRNVYSLAAKRSFFSQPRKTGVQLPWLQIPKVKMFLKTVGSAIHSDEASVFHVLFVCQLRFGWRISILLPVNIQVQSFWPAINYNSLKEHEHREKWK